MDFNSSFKKRIKIRTKWRITYEGIKLEKVNKSKPGDLEIIKMENGDILIFKVNYEYRRILLPFFFQPETIDSARKALLSEIKKDIFKGGLT